MKTLDEYVSIASKATDLAGDFLMKDFGTREKLSVKEGKHFAIGRDRESDMIYRNHLGRMTPQIPVYSEEGQSDLDGELVWMVDSIDGTSNYNIGVPLFATQICLVQNREPVVSVIANPALGEKFTAIKGKGAFANGKRIFVSDTVDIGEALLVQGKGLANINKTAWYMALFGKYVRTVRIFGGCTAFDLALLASGKCDIVINLNSKLHDFAPGVLLAREAGAIVANLKGNEWTIDDDSLVAAGPKLMPRVMEIIRQASNN